MAITRLGLSALNVARQWASSSVHICTCRITMKHDYLRTTDCAEYIGIDIFVRSVRP